jgi:ABC-type cobalt transport system substrate-binding protein
MSTSGLFIVGALVTLIVAIALVLLVYAAVLDGRYAAAQRAASETLHASEPDVALTSRKAQPAPEPGAGSGAELGPAVAMMGSDQSSNPLVT